MRDVAIRRGVIRVVEDFRSAPRPRRAVSNGCSLLAAGRRPVGRDATGHLMVPAITLFALVPGIRSQVPDGRDRLIEYLVENFEELVYV